MSISTQVAGWMTIAGAVAGPGYSLYCDYLSGSNVGTFKMSQIVRSWATADGRTLDFAAVGAYKPFTVGLDPQMNPVGFVWSGDVGRDKFVKYRAQLYLRDQQVMDKSVTISGGKEGGSQSASIGAATVPSAGEYLFVLEPSRDRDRYGASSLEVEVRRNVVVKNKRIFWPGLTLLVVSFFLYLWLKNRERKAMYELEEDVRGSQDHELLAADFTVPAGTCPYCKKPLKSPRAKQCLLCGADWHLRGG